MSQNLKGHFKLLRWVLVALLFTFLGYVGHLIHMTLESKDLNYVEWCKGQGGTYYLYSGSHLCLRDNQPISPPATGLKWP